LKHTTTTTKMKVIKVRAEPKNIGTTDVTLLLCYHAMTMPLE